MHPDDFIRSCNDVAISKALQGTFQHFFLLWTSVKTFLLSHNESFRSNHFQKPKATSLYALFSQLQGLDKKSSGTLRPPLYQGKILPTHFESELGIIPQTCNKNYYDFIKTFMR